MPNRGAHLTPSPVLFAGDAVDLLELLKAGARRSGATVVDGTTTDPARIVIVAIIGEGRRSSIAKAFAAIQRLGRLVAADAILIAVVQSGRARFAPPRIQRFLSSEILFQIALAVPHLVRRPRWSSFRRGSGLTALDAAGLRILRFG